MSEQVPQPEPTPEAVVLEPPAAPAPSSSGPADSPGALPLDPSRFAVDAENHIEVQPEETLGHYADWLQVSASTLRRLNGLERKTPVRVGGRLKLDLSRASPADFERLRLAHHRALQKRFFDTHRIAGTEQYVLRRGDTLWRLAQKNPSVPMWLIRDYNPSLDFGALRPGASVTVPRVERRG